MGATIMSGEEPEEPEREFNIEPCVRCGRDVRDYTAEETDALPGLPDDGGVHSTVNGKVEGTVCYPCLFEPKGKP